MGLFTLATQLPSPLYKTIVWGTCMRLTMVIDLKLQFPADPNKPILAGEITGSLLVSGQHYPVATPSFSPFPVTMLPFS